MRTRANSSESIGYRALIRGNRNFRLLWLGQIISLLGDWFNFVASASLIAILTQSGFTVGSLFVVRMLAPFFISPIAGVVADRYNRKYTLIITDLARVVVAFDFLLVRTADDVWLLYVLTLLQLDDVEVYKMRTSFYHKRADYDRAIADYTQVIELNPDFAIAYSISRLAYFDNGNPIRGQKDLDKSNVLQYHRKEKDD